MFFDDQFLSDLQKRLWLKAEAARLAAEYHRADALTGPTTQHVVERQRLIAEAKTMQCYLWMMNALGHRPTNIDDFDLIAACFETVAETVGVLRFALQEFGATSIQVKRSLELTAEAQSALRVAVAACDDYSDEDQKAVFLSLTEVAAKERIFLKEGMTLDDPIDPSMWADIAGRAYALGNEFDSRVHRIRKQNAVLGSLSQKASLLADSTIEPERDAWKEVTSLVDVLVAIGVPPSSIEFRDVLMPIADRLPRQMEMSKSFGLVIREIERFKTLKEKPKVEALDEAPTPEVVKVAKLLKGKSLLMIGGEGRQEAKDAIEEAFGLKELEWIDTTSHESYRSFEPFVARKDVAAVLLLIRWASHSFGEVQEACDRHSKPLVRLPGGYNPNQIAAAIMKQASRRIGPTNRRRKDVAAQ